MKRKSKCMILLALISNFLVFSGSVLAKSERSGDFAVHATISGVGKALNALVSKGPGEGDQRLYVSLSNMGGSFDIVAIDPLKGSRYVFTSPLAGESVAWAMAKARTGEVYVGTAPHAHIMRLDWMQRRLVDLGRPATTETYIWQLALGSDGKLYGGTFPHAKLIEFDPVTGKSVDLGEMNESEKYARFVAADNNGFVYIGIGMAHGDLVAYDVKTGRHRSIMPVHPEGLKVVKVVRGADGKVYAKLDRWMQLSGWSMKPYSGSLPFARMRLKNNALVSLNDAGVRVKEPSGQVRTLAVSYPGKPQSIFRIGLGPDSKIYGSTAIPARLFWASLKGSFWGEIGGAGAGEVYSFVSTKRRLFAAGYSTLAPIFSYEPGRPWAPGVDAGDSPRLVHSRGENESWRPSAMVLGRSDNIYIGSTPGYGLLGGSLCLFNPNTGEVQRYKNVVKNQSVTALVVLPNGFLVGGTSIYGGGGSTPVEKDARLFLWDTITKNKIFQLIPVPGQGVIDAMALGKNGNVYGFAGSVLFVFDPSSRKMVTVKPSSVGRVIYGAIGPAANGVLYGVSNLGVFEINTDSNEARLLATYPGGITGGFAISGRDIYFTQGATLVSYRLPRTN